MCIVLAERVRKFTNFYYMLSNKKNATELSILGCHNILSGPHRGFALVDVIMKGIEFLM